MNQLKCMFLFLTLGVFLNTTTITANNSHSEEDAKLDNPQVAGLLYNFYINPFHGKIDNENTKNKVTVEFWAGFKKLSSSTKVPSSTTKDTYWTYAAAPSSSVVTHIMVRTNGSDAMYIDKAYLKVSGQSQTWGKDGGKGWCLSTDPKDAKGSWKSYIGEGGCQSSVQFNLSSKVKSGLLKLSQSSVLAPNVQVTLDKIVCVKENDGGGSEEEVYGNIYVEVKGVRKELWKRSQRGNLGMKKGQVYDFDQTAFYANVKSTDEITLGGKLKEYDDDTVFNPDDNLGSESVKVTSRTPSTVLSFKQGGTRIDVHFRISKPKGRYLHIKNVKCVSPSKGTSKWTTFGVAMAIEGAGILATGGFSKVAAAKYVVKGAGGSSSIIFPGKMGELESMVGSSSSSHKAAKELIDFTLKVHGNDDDDLYLSLAGHRIWPDGRWRSIGSQDVKDVNIIFPLKKDLSLKLKEYDKVSSNDFMGVYKFLASGKNALEAGDYTVHIMNEKESSYYELSFEILSY